jgi:hypothetical protein
MWCLLACLMLTGVVWLLGQRLSGIELAPDQGASWYYWKLRRTRPSGLTCQRGSDTWHIS